MRRKLLSGCLITLATLAAVFASLPCDADEIARPKIVGLKVFPESLELSNSRDVRRVIVTGLSENGRTYDLTAESKLKPSGPAVAVDGEGYNVPQAAGAATIAIAAAGLEAKLPVVVKNVDAVPVSFVRDVIPAISKVGCNAGTCHGAQAGRAGFKLSLRGYDPLFDYRALIDDESGRRFNRSNPSQSLMLLKPTQGVPHEGGFLFDEDSRNYKLFHDWISQGCKFDTVGRTNRVEVFPEKPVLQNPGDIQQTIVIAHFADGTSRDVTRDAVFQISNFEVATVGKTGLIEAVRRGESAVLVRYEGQYATAPIIVIGSREGYKWNDSPEYNFVDTHVNNKLKQTKILPSDLCTDAEFLRRISLDLSGIPPTAEITRAFLDDPRDSRTKRAEMAEKLLAGPNYVDHWTLKWSDLLLSNRKYIQEKGVWAFRNWIRNSIAANKPYDQFAYELVTASGSTFENPAANYYRISREPKVVMENMTQVFLGTRFQCNQCHDHPFERWTQQQYYELASFFSAVGRKGGTRPDEELVYSLATPQGVVNPRTGVTVAATFPFEHAGMDKSSTDGRQQLAKWLTAKENPYFARSVVNRYWSYFTGLGIIDPVDDIRASNPASNPELLDALTKDFVEHGFDLKHLVRTIVASHTYQRSFKTNDWNNDDKRNYSHAIPRRLSAEQLYDAIIIATGAKLDIPGVPVGFRATQLPDPQIDVSFLDMFGRAPRESPCECERSKEVSLAQTLNLINGPTVSNAIIHPQGLIARLAEQNADSKQYVENVYMSVVCRRPTEQELQTGIGYLAQAASPREGAEDFMWALINSPEFLFNR